MVLIRVTAGLCMAVLFSFALGPTASAQEKTWDAVERMSYDIAVQTYRDCGLRKRNVDAFVEELSRGATSGVPQKKSATITVEYSADFPAEAQAAFARAVEIWESHIASPVSIEIEAHWNDLEPGVLGGAGPYVGLVDTNDDGTGDTILGFPLLDALTGSDQFPDNPDIFAQFNSSRDDWHFGEEPAPSGTMDFTSVVLHEIAHGLNYVDYFNYSGGTGGYGLDFDGNGQIEDEERSPGPFEIQMVMEEQGSGSFVSLIDEQNFPNPSQDLGDALTSDQIFYQGEEADRGAVQGDGPVPAKLYAPSTFQDGSSIAHLDESTYPTGSSNGLITPFLNSAETIRTPGAILCGQLKDMGWTLGTGCQQYLLEVFALQLQEAGSEQEGSLELSWPVGEGADVQEYFVERRYFDGPFQTVRQIDASGSGDEPSVTFDDLGLGAFTFRLRWVRSNGTEETSPETVSDTINVRDVTAEVTSRDEQERGTVAFSWTEPSGTSGFSYQVERQEGTEGPFHPVTTTTQTSVTAEQQTPGRYRYRVRSEDGEGNVLTSSAEEVEIEFDGDVYALGPYPNPVRDQASFELTARQSQSVTMEIYNSLGQRMYEEERELDAHAPVTLSIDAGQWASGMYFVRVRGDEGFVETQKMVVLK